MWKRQVHNDPEHPAGELYWDPSTSGTQNCELPGLRQGYHFITWSVQYP